MMKRLIKKSAFFNFSQMNWIKFISLKKIINILKVYLSYYLSILLRRVIIWGYPYSLTTEPTNSCNLNCLECPTGNKTSNREQGFIQTDIYKKIIDEAKDFAIYQMIYFQGEPFLHPNIFELIKIADQNKIYTCTSTNGHYLSAENCQKIIQSGLKKLIVSVDGTDQTSYEKYRVGGNLAKVTAGIKALVLEKRNKNSSYPKVHLQFLVFKHNEHQIPEIKKLAKKLGVDKLSLKSAQIENFEKNSKLLPSTDKYSRYLTGSFHIKTKTHLNCFRVWSTAVFSWEGTLIPCCFDKNLDYKLGSIEELSLRKLWKSSVFNRFRKKVVGKRKKVGICGNCSEGLRIKY